jgi:signal transduction histidine kinase
LGLAIVRGIVEAHEGQVWAESAGHNEQTCPGSQFHVVLPIQQTNHNSFP